MELLNILVTAASRRVPLVHAFQEALKACRVKGRVVVTDVNPLSPAVHASDRCLQCWVASGATKPREGSLQAVEVVIGDQQTHQSDHR